MEKFIERLEKRAENNSIKLAEVSEETKVNSSRIRNLEKYDAKQNGSIQKIDAKLNKLLWLFINTLVITVSRSCAAFLQLNDLQKPW